MSKAVFERTGTAQWVQVAVRSFSCMVFLWLVNLQRDKKQGSTSDGSLQPEWRFVQLSTGKEIVATGG